MPKEKVESVQAGSTPPELTPVETGPLDLATYSLVGLDDQGEQIYVPILARSYSKAELLIPAIAETLHLLGWPHIQKN